MTGFFDNKQKLAHAANLVVGGMSFFAWLAMTSFEGETAVLASGGLGNLRFFTVLSNLFNGAVALLYLVRSLKHLPLGKTMRTLKLVSNTAVALTFLMVVCFIGPANGFFPMYRGGNFWFHFVLPCLSVLSFLFLEVYEDLSLKSASLAVVPTFLYALYYLLAIVWSGQDSSGAYISDHYRFLTWGFGAGIAIALAIHGLTYLIARVLLKVSAWINAQSSQ